MTDNTLVRPAPLMPESNRARILRIIYELSDPSEVEDRVVDVYGLMLPGEVVIPSPRIPTPEWTLRNEELNQAILRYAEATMMVLIYEQYECEVERARVELAYLRFFQVSTELYAELPSPQEIIERLSLWQEELKTALSNRATAEAEDAAFEAEEAAEEAAAEAECH